MTRGWYVAEKEDVDEERQRMTGHTLTHSYSVVPDASGCSSGTTLIRGVCVYFVCGAGIRVRRIRNKQQHGIR